MKKKLLFWCLPIVSGFVLAFSLDTSWSSWLALFGLVPFLVFLAHAKNKKFAFLGGWLAGSVLFLWNLRWFLVTHPETWTGVQSVKVVFLTYFTGWFITAVVLGLCFGAFGLISFFWLRKTNAFFSGEKTNACFSLFSPNRREGSPAGSQPAQNNIGFFADTFFLSSVWILLEYLRSWLYSIWFWGPESLIGPHWSLGDVGYALINTPASILARYVGIYGLSFLVIFINVLIFCLLISDFNRLKLVGLAFFLLLIFVFIPFVAPDYSSDLPAGEAGKKIKVDVLQTNEQPFFYYKSLTELLENNPLPKNPSNLTHLVVFPEGSNFFSVMTKEAKETLDSIFSEDEKGLVISSALFKDGDLKYEKSIYRNKDGKLLSLQKKSFLVPVSEFLPYLIEAVLRISNFDQEIMAFNSNRHYSKAETKEKPVLFSDIKIGTLICSGVLSPVFYRDLAREGAEVLVNSSSHAYFNSLRPALFYTETYARFHAIANARPFLQASEGDYAFIIDANGNFVERGHVLGNQFISGEVGIVDKRTLYTKLGDWPLVLAFIFIMGASIHTRRYRLEDPI